MSGNVQMVEDRPVDVLKHGKWLPGAIVGIDASHGTVRVRYQSPNGSERECNVDLPNGNGTMRLKRGSTYDGTAYTGKRFPRDAKTHKCVRCGDVKVARAFPTDGPDYRLGECRDCRDSRTASGILGR